MSTTTLGELISTLFQAFMDEYGDTELASVATAAVINDMLTRGDLSETEEAA